MNKSARPCGLLSARATACRVSADAAGPQSASSSSEGLAGSLSLLARSAAKSRRSFALRGPYGLGVPVYSTLIDTRGTPRLYASSCNPFFGMKVLRSTDIGKSFTETKSAPAFPKGDGRALANIWALEAGGGKKDLWCGVEPASLFRSHDGGDSWDLVPGISNHDHARKWQPGNGGLCMHTIIRDGNRMHLGISTGGHYLSEDGGETFRASNEGVGAGFAPDPYPEFGQCVHKIARHDAAPGRLYMQNHGGWADWTGPGGPRPDIGVLHKVAARHLDRQDFFDEGLIAARSVPQQDRQFVDLGLRRQQPFV